jgi:hypothetical protein
MGPICQRAGSREIATGEADDPWLVIRVTPPSKKLRRSSICDVLAKSAEDAKCAGARAGTAVVLAVRAFMDGHEIGCEHYPKTGPLATTA